MRPEALCRSYIGLEAVEAYRLMDDHRDVLATVKSILTTSYRIHLGPAGEHFIMESFEALLECGTDPNTAVLSDLFANRRAECRRLGLWKDRGTYKEGSLLRSIKIVGCANLRGVVVDVGADDNRMGQVLLKACHDTSAVIGVDIDTRTPLTEPGRLFFKRQEDPTKLPIDDGYADTVIMRFSLHHMNFDTQNALLADARRILKPAGRLVIFEDTYSTLLPPLVNHHIHAQFMNLGDPTKYLITLAFLDASSCFVLDETMPFYFSFRSMEEWQDQLSALGFKKCRVDYWGIPFFSLFQAPLGVIVYELDAWNPA